MSASFPIMSAADTRKTERRDEILAAALRVFADKGYHDAGIADIAGLLGMGHGTFYRYFKNKHDIALAVLDHVVMRFAAIGLLEDPSGTDTLEAYRQQVERMLTRMVDLGDTEPDLVRFFQMQGFVVDAVRLGRAMDAFALYAALFLENGVKKGFLRADLDVVLTSQGLIALMFEGARRALVESDAAARRRWVDAGMRLMFDGIAR